MNTKKVAAFVEKTETLEKYINEMKSAKVLSAEEERKLFKEYMNTEDKKKREEIRNKIITSNQRFFYSIAKHYDNGELLLDLIQEANIAVLDNFDKYDPESGVRFCTYMSFFIRRGIYYHKNYGSLAIKPTVSDRVAPRVKKIENDFLLKNGRTPTTDEIIEILDDEFDIEVNGKEDMYMPSIESIDCSFNDDDDDREVKDGKEFTKATADENTYEMTTESESTSYAIKQIINRLNEREAKVISMYYGIGYDREYKDNEIADKLGYTSERIRQIRHDAEDKFKRLYMKFAY